MRKDYIVAGLSFLGGALVGSAVGYFVARKAAKKQIEEAQETFNKAVNAFRVNKPEKETEPEPETPKNPEGNVAENSKILDYSKIYASKREVKEEVSAPVDESPRVTMVSYSDIESEDYDHNREVLELYENDILIYSVSGEKCSEDEIDRMIGLDNFELLCSGKIVKEETYFWNSELQKYYEVDLMYADYPEE